MAAPTPTTEPDTLIAGDTAKWLITLPDYPATDGWALSYKLANAANTITFAAGASGSDHLVTVAATTTAGWQPGYYIWRSQVSKAGEVFTVSTGSVTIAPALGSATDARSHARKVLDTVEAYLENPANMAAARYQINGRELFRYGIPDLLALRSRYQAEVAREKAAQNVARGLPDKRRIFVRFGP
jgi:hypothetical protein